MPFWNASLSVRIKQCASHHIMLFQSPSGHRFGTRRAKTVQISQSVSRFGMRHEPCGESSALRWRERYSMDLDNLFITAQIFN